MINISIHQAYKLPCISFFLVKNSKTDKNPDRVGLHVFLLLLLYFIVVQTVACNEDNIDYCIFPGCFSPYNNFLNLVNNNCTQHVTSRNETAGYSQLPYIFDSTPLLLPLLSKTSHQTGCYSSFNKYSDLPRNGVVRYP